MKNWLLKKKYRLLPFLICFYLCFFKTMLAPEETKETESVAASEAPQVPAMSFSQGPNFQVPDSSVTVLNLQRRRRGPAGSTVITQAPDVIDETKTGSSPGVVAGTALGAGVLGAAAGAGAALAAMQKELEKVKKERDDALKRPLQATLDKANGDLTTQTARANAAEAALAGRPQLAEHQGVIQARNDAITARQQAEATLATRDQEVATLQAQVQQCHDESGRLTIQNQEKDDMIETLRQNLTAALAQQKPPHDQDPQSPSLSPQPPSPSAPQHRPNLSTGSPAAHDQASDISIQDAESLQLEQANDELRNRYDALNAEHQQLLAKAQQLFAENQTLTQRLSQQQGQNGENSELVARLNNCLTENQLWQQKVQELNQQFQAIISQKDDQINQLTSEKQQLKDDLAQTTQQFKDSIIALREENNQLKNTLQRYEAQYNLLQLQFDLALRERDEALNQARQLQAQLAQLGNYSSDLAWARTEIDRLTQENAVLRQENADLVKRAQALIDQQKNEIDKLTQERDQVLAKFTAFQAEHANCAAQIKAMNDQKASDDKTIQDQATEIVQLKTEIDRLKTQVAGLGGSTTEIARLNDLIKAKDTELARLNALLQQEKDELRNCQISAADLQTQFTQFRALADAVKRENQRLGAENRQLQDKLDKAEQELEAQKQKSRSEMVDLRRQFAELQQQLDDCTTRNISLLAQIQRLTTQFSGPLPYGSSHGSSLHSTGSNGYSRPPSSNFGGGGYLAPQSSNSRPQGPSSSSQIRPSSMPQSLVISFGGSLPLSQQTQTHDPDGGSSIISTSDSLIYPTESRPNVPTPARPQTSDFSEQANFPEGDEHNGGGGTIGSSHLTNQSSNSSTISSHVQPPVPAPSTKKEVFKQGEASRIAQGPSTAKLLGLKKQSPIQGETERFQKDASSASSLMQASGRPR